MESHNWTLAQGVFLKKVPVKKVPVSSLRLCTSPGQPKTSSAKFPKNGPIILLVSKRAYDQCVFFWLTVTEYFSSSSAVVFRKCVEVDHPNPLFTGRVRIKTKELFLVELVNVWQCFSHHVCIPRAPHNVASCMVTVLVLGIRVITNISLFIHTPCMEIHDHVLVERPTRRLATCGSVQHAC